MENHKTCRECKKKMNVMNFMEGTSFCVACYNEREHRAIWADPYGGDDLAYFGTMDGAW